MRVCFYTLGCKVNLNETGALEQMFRANGFTIAQENEPADVFVVNSCTVTNLATRKAASGCAAKNARTRRGHGAYRLPTRRLSRRKPPSSPRPTLCAATATARPF